MTATIISKHEFAILSDEDVMELLQSGYDQALSELVNRYESRVIHFVNRYTKNLLDAQDVVQETFLRVYRSRHRYQRIAKFSTWLYTIAFNLTKTMHKRSTKMQTDSIYSEEEDQRDLHEQLINNSISPDDQLEQNLCMQYLNAALEKLPLEFKEAVILRDIKQLTYDEIVEMTGVPMGTVKSRINRGRARLKNLLGNLIPKETIYRS